MTTNNNKYHPSDSPLNLSGENQLETIVLGGGCFWCTEAIFKNLKGVTNVTSGYAGGNMTNPSYEKVSGGNTGHVEVVKIEFNPEQISLADILEVFFALHDATTMNQQGADIGSQYRSLILYSNEAQRVTAEEAKAKVFKAVTEIKPLDKFFKAEDYHQNYYENNDDYPYCQVIISPKLIKLKEKFGNLTK